MSRLFPFIMNNWLSGKDSAYVELACDKHYITEEERDIILATIRY